MGTVVEIQLEIDGVDRDDDASVLADELVAEMIRLQAICSSVDLSSEFSRWLSGAVPLPSEELTTVLTEAARWQKFSKGRFNPAVGELTNLWSDAEAAGVEPDQGQLAEIVAAIAEPPWAISESGTVLLRAETRSCTLNAFAKGWIVDRAIELARSNPEVRAVTVNAGGDLRCSGGDGLVVGIEDPFRPFDNAAPIAAISLIDGALATSGSARRSFVIDGERFSHVIDPRNGQPVAASPSISVTAPTAAEADVWSTILGVEEPHRALDEADRYGLAVFLVMADGTELRSRRWWDLEVPLS